MVTQLRRSSPLGEQIREQLSTHADGHIFTSLPRAGSVRAARLLAEIGGARSRYLTPEALICAAGVAPSTRQSGKVTIVSFRWSADKQLRDAVCEFAGDSRLSNPWAADLYNRARARGQDHPHAGAHPRPRLAAGDLTLLAGRRGLPPRPAPSPATGPRSGRRCGRDPPIGAGSDHEPVPCKQTARGQSFLTISRYSLPSHARRRPTRS